MKHLKRINEDWSDDFVYDFKDNGFQIEEKGKILTGQYKGKFLITQVSSWFAEMVAKMEDEYKIIRAKNYFNEVTGNANFEIEVIENQTESIEVTVSGEKVEYFPSKVDNFSNYYGGSVSISISGTLKNGKKKTLGAIAGAGNPKINRFNFGNKGTGISVDSENMAKLFAIIESDTISIFINGYKYSQLPEEKKQQYLYIKTQLS